MYIPDSLYPQKTYDTRTEFLLSFSNIFALCFSFLYFLLLLSGYIRFKDSYVGFSLLSGIVVNLLFLSSYIVNRKKYIQLSLIILTTTILTICTLAGIWWGFDLPSVLLGYVLSIVIVATVGSKKQNTIHLLVVIAMMVVGQLYRNTLLSPENWYGQAFELNDMVEIFIIFTVITALLIFSERSRNKLLSRAKRTEHMLKEERDTLEIRIEEKITELKKTQIEHLSTMYRFVEFGKLSSGLFHDLMSPVQTLKIYMESFPKNQLDEKTYTQIERMQTVSQKIESMLESMRKQIRFNQDIETFDLVHDIQEILLIIKHLQLKRNINISIISDSNTYLITTKRVILNHIILNIISNACEACDPEKTNNSITIHVGNHVYQDFTSYISITDTGVGIKEKNLKNIFNNFYSTKNKQISDGPQNCGIGLSSSKYALEKHLNGKLLVESEECIGTTMTILL